MSRRGGIFAMDTSGSIAKTSSRNSSAGNRSRSLPTTPAIWTARRKSSALPHHGSRCAGVANVATPRIRSSSAAVARAQRTTKTEAGHRNLSLPSSTRSRIVFRSARHCVAEKVPVLPPTPRACRSRRSIPTRSPCARPVPARDRPPDDPSPWRAQTVHDDQRVTRERPRARRRDSKVQERGTALELLVSEHRARCLGAEPEVRGDRRGRRGTAPNSSRV